MYKNYVLVNETVVVQGPKRVTKLKGAGIDFHAEE